MRIGSFIFKPGLWPSVATCFFLVLTMGLGNWQLSRAEYKQSLQERYDAMQNDGVVRLTGDAVDIEELRFRPVELRGSFLNEHEILIDNRVYRSLAGYHVATPFHIEGTDQHVLVNRGWVKVVGRSREQLPEVKKISGVVVLQGVAVDPQSRYYELAGAAPQGKLWQNLNFKEYSERFGKPLLPVLVEQTVDTGDGLVRDWPRPDTGVGTHISYAIQWFGLAATLVVLWIVLNTKRTRSTEEK